MSEPEDKESFLSRWSRRKQVEQRDDVEPVNESNQRAVQTDEQTQTLDTTTVPESANSEESLPIWQQKEADPILKRDALRALFQQEEFHLRDGLNDYDHDFTQERSLGNIVTNQMKRMIRLAEEKSRPDEVDIEANEPLNQNDEPEQDSEDKPVA
jgi:hypothetical protein